MEHSESKLFWPRPQARLKYVRLNLVFDTLLANSTSHTMCNKGSTVFMKELTRLSYIHQQLLAKNFQSATLSDLQKESILMVRKNVTIQIKRVQKFINK